MLMLTMKTLFTESSHCQSGVHCQTCRDLEGGRDWRRSLCKSFTLPDDAPDFACPFGIPYGESPPPRHFLNLAEGFVIPMKDAQRDQRKRDPEDDEHDGRDDNENADEAGPVDGPHGEDSLARGYSMIIHRPGDLLQAFIIHATEGRAHHGIGCEKMRKSMNAGGWLWCWQNRTKIMARMRREARQFFDPHGELPSSDSYDPVLHLPRYLRIAAVFWLQRWRDRRRSRQRST